MNTGERIRMFPDTDIGAYIRLINQKGYEAKVGVDCLIVGEPLKPPTDRVKIGQSISKARKKFAYTVEELAEEVGVPKQTVIDWEKGNKVPNKEHTETLRILIDWGIDNG
jgi:DNA-binding XRE family transcriptional regulator